MITRTPVQDAWARASLGRVGASAWSQDSCVKDGTSYLEGEKVDGVPWC